MRRNPTVPEAKMWQLLRRKRLDGFRFRRQHPIDPYIVDFYCHEVKLIVEIDGDSHIEQMAYDVARTQWLEAQGCTVIRFWNSQVAENAEGVALKILEVCNQIASLE